jgi:hypothetical protein
VVALVRSRQGGLINRVDDVGGWPTLVRMNRDLDGDLDGLPNGWEADHGFDHVDPEDKEDRDGDGYTNLEEFLNGTEP